MISQQLNYIDAQHDKWIGLTFKDDGYALVFVANSMVEAYEKAVESAKLVDNLSIYEAKLVNLFYKSPSNI